MLSATARISTKCYWQVLLSRGLCSASTKPRKRKNAAGVRAAPVEAVAPSEATEPPVANRKLLKAASKQVSSSVPAKNISVPIPGEKKPEASTPVPSNESLLPKMVAKKKSSPPPMNASDLSSLLSLDEPEQVSNYPILKTIDFTIPVEEFDFSNVTNPNRVLSALRLCHKYSHGCAYIGLHMATLSGPAVLEAARLLADAELRRRCAPLKHSTEVLPDIATFSRDLLEKFKSTRLPQSMAVAINVLLGCVIDAARTVAEISVDEMKQMIYRAEVHHHVACAALDLDQWDNFKCIMTSCPLSPHFSPILVYHIVNFVLKNSQRKEEVMEWYLTALSAERKPLTQLQWSNYTTNIIKACGTKSEPVSVTRSGKIEVGAGRNQELSLPKEQPFDQHDFSCLKSDLNNLLNDLSKGSGSVTRKEVSTLRKCIHSWSKGYNERVVVIDSLNVFHGGTNGFGPLVRLTNSTYTKEWQLRFEDVKLTSEYDNAVLVTRPFLAEKLKSVRWRGNVRVFSCSTLSEDDLLVLLAAVEWGPNAYVLSNDRFGVHVERANCTGRLSLEEWMRRRVLRFNKSDWQYDAIPEYGEFVQQVTPGTYFLPISEETPGIPQRSARLVTL
ncbi:hypothetical protein GCK32_010921 [Trichostrongylus colubriformis]|uniref:Uncharacterized protein n=1 Tax=Trichostrongylus colubriformis TaxID=6319 RepID=A0AAN8ICU3_TRICO